MRRLLPALAFVAALAAGYHWHGTAHQPSVASPAPRPPAPVALARLPRPLAPRQGQTAAAVPVVTRPQVESRVGQPARGVTPVAERVLSDRRPVERPEVSIDAAEPRPAEAVAPAATEAAPVDTEAPENRAATVAEDTPARVPWPSRRQLPSLAAAVPRSQPAADAGFFFRFNDLFARQMELANVTAFMVTDTIDSGFGSLRQAILDANGNPGMDTILFAIPGPGPHTITLSSALPSITDSVVIDGYSQTDAAVATGTTPATLKVVLNAGGLVNATGLRLQAVNSQVQGLVVQGFTGTTGVGIEIAAGNCTVAGCYLGTDVTGTSAVGNGAGVAVNTITNAVIGGNTPAARNVIGGNTYGVRDMGSNTCSILGNYIGLKADGSAALGNTNGIYVSGGTNHLIGADVGVNPIGSGPGNVISGNQTGVYLHQNINGATVCGNLIGTTPDGTAALLNTARGVQTGTTNTAIVIGGPTAGKGNVISGNGDEGILLSAGTAATVQGNLIGLNVDSDPLSNGSHGIWVQTSNALIGGTTAGMGNTIAYNQGDGIYFDGGTGNRARGNAIHGNAGLGIDLAQNGVNSNDGGDADTGVNNKQNYPTLAYAGSDGSATLVGGSLDSDPTNAAYPISVDFYRVDSADGTGYGEGDEWLGELSVAGPGNFEKADLPAVPVGQFISATATDANGNTSEFSASKQVIGQAAGAYVVYRTTDSGAGSLRQAILNANAHAGADTIVFAIPGSGPQTIPLASALPTVTGGALTIDGYSQPGAAVASGSTPATLNIVLDGSSLSGVNALTLDAAGSVVAGLVVQGVGGASGTGISIDADSCVVRGCFIGTDATGMSAVGNAIGIHVANSADAVIGGGTVAHRNVIGGNSQYGIYVQATSTGCVVVGNYIGLKADGSGAIPNLQGVTTFGSTNLRIGSDVGGGTLGQPPGNVISGNQYGVYIGTGSTGTTVVGNLIGTAPSGMAAVANTHTGIVAGGATGITIGGSPAGERNVISGNAIYGIYPDSGTVATVLGNFIGVGIDGNQAVGNGSDGLYVTSSNCIIGGGLPGEANVIAHNGGAGIRMPSGTANALTRNAIHQNNGLGIDLGTAGVTANDAGDSDTGANNLQNFPVLDYAGSNGSWSIVGGMFDSDPTHTAYPVTFEFFNSGGADSSGYGEGQVCLGSFQVSAPGYFEAALGTSLGAGTVVTATATDSNGNTSEFSQAVGVTAIPTNTLVVYNTNDAGPGSLREAINQANVATGDTIVFNLPPRYAVSGVYTITPLTALPTITADGITINGMTQPGYGPHPVVELNGSAAGAGQNGLTFSGADGCVVVGLCINRFTASGINAAQSDQLTVRGCYLGTDPAGLLDRGNATYGLLLHDSAQATIGGDQVNHRNVISGNNQSGIALDTALTTGCWIGGNYIGTDATGANAIPNTNIGIRVAAAAANTIGDSGAGNLLSGNGTYGIEIGTDGADNNLIQANTIGLTADQSAALPNTADGLFLSAGENTTIGGGSGLGNVIAGNGQHGIATVGNVASPITGLVIKGNRIGLNVSDAAVPNTQNGIRLGSYTTGTLIGGTDAADRNYVSGNGASGLEAASSTCSGTQFVGNWFGLDSSGAAKANTTYGIFLNWSPNNTIGGTTADHRNVISGNTQGGLFINGTGSRNNQVYGNYIGTNPAGDAAVANGSTGLRIYNSSGNTIGGATAGHRNVISGNIGNGVYIFDAGATGNQVLGNHIGLDPAGQSAIPNTSNGVQINSAGANTIGLPGAGNVVCANGVAGVLISGVGADNLIQSNIIGLSADQTVDLGNAAPGIGIYSGGSGTTIGGSGAGNVIAGNDAFGIQVHCDDPDVATGIQILGNRIGLNESDAAFPNALDGIAVVDNATGTTIGGSDPALRNYIAGNGLNGINLVGATNTAAVIRGNWIGLDSTGSPTPNGEAGILIAGALNSTIGGTLPNEPNLIVGNTGAGIAVSSGTSNALRGNTILDNGGLGIDLGADGLTGNDPEDTDTGANNLQNFPVLDYAGSDGSSTLVGGVVDSGSGSSAYPLTLDFYRVTSPDGSGFGEGDDWLGAIQATHPGPFQVYLPTAVPPGEYVTATATDSDGNTSEFSLATPVETRGIKQRVVYNTNDSGAGSLRQAILDVNSTTGGEIIFRIPSDYATSGLYYIAPTGSDLPDIGEPTVIDGSTQPGFVDTPVIVLVGSAAGPGGIGFRINTTDDCFIGSLCIHSFASYGIDIAEASNTVVQGCRIGVDPSGTMDLGNGDHGINLTAAADTIIGGTTAGGGNLISGNGGDGVHLEGPSVSGTQILANGIGVDATGTAAIGNDGNGVHIHNGSANTVGGAPAGGNLIAGNQLNGVRIIGAAADANRVENNDIGVDATGDAALGNGEDGIQLRADVQNTTIANNLVSGHAPNNGIDIESGDGTVIRGNYIGTDHDGDTSLPNGDGILLRYGNGVWIGGPNPGDGNVISGNEASGILVWPGLGPISGTKIINNLIGVREDGTTPLGNGANGIELNGPTGTQVGGLNPSHANTIAYNGWDGVQIDGGDGNAVRGNRIDENGDLGIDLQDDGVSANDPADSDTGPNHLQNYPVLTAAYSTGSATFVDGTIDSDPGASAYPLELDFYVTDAPDPSGFGEGPVFAGSTTIAGPGTFHGSLWLPVTPGDYVTATVTDADGNTSEFSEIIRTAGDPTQLVISSQPTDTLAGQPIAAVSVEVRDANGLLVPDATDSITLTPVGGSPGPLGGTNPRAAVDGVATFDDLSATVAGSYELEASAGGLTPATSAAFTILPAATDAAQSAVVLDKSTATADGSDTVTCTVTLRDAYGNPRPNVAPSNLLLTAAPNDGVGIVQPTVATDADGKTTATFTSTRAGTVEVRVNAEGVDLATRPQVTFQPGAADTGQSTLTADKSTATADGAETVTLTVTVKDSAGNPRPGIAAGDIVVTAAPSDGVTIVPPATATDTAGSTTATVTATKAQTVTFSATAEGAAVTQTAPVTFAPGAATQLRFAQQPAGTTAGTTLAPVTVEILDAHQNRVVGAGLDVVLTLVAPPGTTPAPVLSGTLTQPASGGVATFADLTVDRAAIDYRVHAAASGLTPADSAPFTITPSAAVALRVVDSPTDQTAGVALAPVTVEIIDSFGNRVASTATVTAAPAAGTPAMGGTAAVAAVSGLATFGDLVFQQAGTGYGLTFTAPSLTGASAGTFTIRPAAATRLSFAVQPTSIRALAPFNPVVAVEFLDAFGNRDLGAAGAVTIALQPGAAGATLRGTATVTAAQGLATFGDLSVDKVGTGHRLGATSGALTGATSDPFAVTANVPVSLAFRTPPSDVAAGAAITPPVEVELRDAAGNPTLDDAVAVTIALESGPAGAILSGTTTRQTANGVATFADLSLDRAGAGCTLAATAGQLVRAVSPAFTVQGAAVDLAASTLTASPASVIANGRDAIDLLLTLRDRFGNPRPGIPPSQIAVAVSAGGLGDGLVLTGPAAASDAAGRMHLTAQATRPQTATLAVTYDATLTWNADVAFTPRPVDAARSEVRLTPELIAADGAEEAVVAVTLRDGEGVPVEGIRPADRGVGLAGEAAAQVTIADGGAATGQDGRYQVRLTAAAPGDIAVTPRAAGVTLAEVTLRARHYLDLTLGTGINFVGLPIDCEPKNLSELLAKPGLRAVCWDCQAQTYDPVETSSSRALDDRTLQMMASGRAVWVETEQPTTHRLLGAYPTSGARRLVLQPGWNAIGNPYRGDLSWTPAAIRVEVDGADVGSLDDQPLWASTVLPYGWTWLPSVQPGYSLVFDPTRPGFSQALGGVPQWGGLWVRALRSGVTLVLPGPSSRSTTRASRAVTPNDWTIRLTARMDTDSDVDNLFGCGADLSRMLGIASPPPAEAPAAVDLRFVEPTSGERLAGLLQPGGRELEWTAEVLSRAAGDVTLSWPGLLREAPKGLLVELSDQTTGRTMILNTRASYNYPAAAGETRRFGLTTRFGNLARSVITSLDVTASRAAGTRLTVTLSGPAELTITVRGLSGRLVKQFTETVPAGTTSLVWDGTDQQGRRVPHGVYQIEAVAAGPNGAASRAVRPVAVD